MTRPRTPVDAGYTVLEMVVTIALAGTLMAIAVSGWQGWTRSVDHEGTATRIQSVLRDAQQRAVTEGSSICVSFSTAADSWTVRRGSCASPGAQLDTDTVDAGHVGIDQPTFADGAGSPGTGVTFFPRGTATPGKVDVVREGTDTVWTVRVEGLTGRVSIS